MKLVIELDDDLYNFIHADRLLAMDVPEVEQAIKNGTPLPEHHGRIIDESKITSVYYHEETYKSTVRHYHTVIDGTDAPTIIEGSDSE